MYLSMEGDCSWWLRITYHKRSTSLLLKHVVIGPSVAMGSTLHFPPKGELVIFGVDARKPFLVLGIVSAYAKSLRHKVDLKLNRSTLCHNIRVSERYNIVVDMRLTMDINRLAKVVRKLIKFEKESYARIGVLPGYGDADSVKWFEVATFCTFHIVNCFENGDEVIVRGFRAPNSIIPGPEKGLNKYHWSSEGFKPMPEKECGNNSVHGGFFCWLFQWRLNLRTGGFSGRYLTGFDSSMNFPVINDRFTGLYHKYGYAQVVDSVASSTCALPKYGSLAKLYLEEQVAGVTKVTVQYHHLGRNQFCSGATFVPKPGGLEEDEGWIISFVHGEDTDTSQASVRIIDAQRFESEPIARITLPQRVPYGFHRTFIPRARISQFGPS
uniref:Carotenoid 9,10(9',10')-cleavage dioxygenase 1-like n=1 Tax=Ananas comosus var. bracteatus TaxID=296719 RepID=A0A6V7PU93_ANACO|nr:unnamed protein product [Ananas comosus var. bracteatus]